MLTYLSKILGLLLFWLFIILNYYFNYNHIENFDWYTIYIVFITIWYGVYKTIQVTNSVNENKNFSLLEILWYFAGHLLLLSCLFFYYNYNQNITIAQPDFFSGFALFSRVMIYLILPTIIVVTCISFWKKILSYIHGFTEQNNIFQFILNLSFGFFLFVTTVAILGFLGFYNLYSVISIIVLFLLISHRQLRQLGQWFLDFRITISSKEWYGVKLISTEFLFIIATLLLSVNLINALRPFPIGWDDLWAYMNYAQLFAQSWEIFQISQMFSWQVFTWIWYMFNSPTQAFFLNNVWGILSFIVMILIFSDLFKSKSKKHFIPIPLLLATIFISMPMFIFEQAKDMKLDPGFYFISISSFYITLKLFLSDIDNTFKNKLFMYLWFKNINIWSKYIYFVLVWILAGFAFSIKFTALLLFAALFALIFFARLWIVWLFWYISLFFAIFTKFGLWKIMNVSYPSDDINFINTFSLISATIGLWLIMYSFIYNKGIVKTFLSKILAVFIWILVALLPWFIFNVSSADTITINTILSGKSDRLEIDYTKIHSQWDIEAIKDNQKKYSLSSKWTTWHEDFWRYFWYEEGINNYLKLPWNLTMQTNQKWEFTDITYIYLALLPLLLLFLPFRNKYTVLGIVGIVIFEILLFNIPYTRELLTNLLSKYTLPGWYWLLFAWFAIPLIYLLKTLKDTAKNRLLKYNLVFAFFYTFLWTIAAYWIVWYGIVMYFNFLILIGGGIYYLGNYDDNTDKKTKQTKFLGSMVVFIIISIYFFASTVPHAFKNLKTASYKEFKNNDFSSIEAPFLYHWDYLKILFELNISNNKKSDFIDEALSNDIKDLIAAINIKNKENAVDWKYNIINIYNIDELVSNLRNFRRSIIFQEYHNSISKSLYNLYSGIYHPTQEYKNTENIYRIGTFLKYYISENNKRLLEDSLVTQFESYILADTADESVENMKKLWLNYFLVDLNAATIDNDPRRNLTKRYESLLKTFTSDKLELVSTDSICLQLATENYSNSEKTTDDYNKYLWIAWVNYDSFDLDWNRIPRWNKQLDCYRTILNLIETGKVTGWNYNYLLPIQNYFVQNKDLIKNPDKIIQFLQRAVPHGYKVLYKIKD